MQPQSRHVTTTQGLQKIKNHKARYTDGGLALHRRRASLTASSFKTL
jgi:hypothetical protein